MSLDPTELIVRVYAGNSKNGVLADQNHPDVNQALNDFIARPKDSYYRTKDLIDFYLKTNIRLKMISYPLEIDVTDKKMRSALIHYVFAKTSTEVMMNIYKKYYFPK